MREVHDNTAAAARMLYAMATAASNTCEGYFVYDEDLDLFRFPDGSFAFDRERANPSLAKALRLGSE